MKLIPIIEHVTSGYSIQKLKILLKSNLKNQQARNLTILDAQLSVRKVRKVNPKYLSVIKIKLLPKVSKDTQRLLFKICTNTVFTELLSTKIFSVGLEMNKAEKFLNRGSIFSLKGGPGLPRVYK